MRKFNLEKAMENGNIVMGNINKNTKLMVISFKNFYTVIPCIKEKSNWTAYVDPDLSTERYTDIATILECVLRDEVYAGFQKCMPVSKKAPQHPMEIASLVCPEKYTESIVIPAGFNDILNEFGYTREELWANEKPKRDYSELLKDPENKRQFDEMGEELTRINATLESLPKEALIVYDAISGGSAAGAIFAGPTGTGKSIAAQVMAQAMGAPCLNLQITNGTTVDDLVGMYVPSTKNDGTKWEFVPGPLLKAYTEGYNIVIEEVNYGQPGVIAKLNEFTDSTMQVRVADKYYHKHPNFVIYMTMNPGYAGTDPLNVALKNRFAKVDFPALTVSEFAERGAAYSRALGHELPKQFFNELYKFASLIEGQASENGWHEDVKFSIRNAQRLLEKVVLAPRNGDEFFEAICTEFINDLSLDNDNSERLETFKKSQDIRNAVSNIYKYYDLACAKEIPVDDEMEGLFVTCTEEEEVRESVGDIDAILGMFVKK